MDEQTTPARPKRTVAQQLRALLATEGYRPRRVGDEEDPSTIHFKVEGNTFLVRTNEQDPDFVAICTGNTLEDISKDELTLLRAASEAQNDMKVAKVFVPKSLAYVEFQLELFLDGKPFSADLLERCLGTLRTTRRRFYELATPREQPRALA